MKKWFCILHLKIKTIQFKTNAKIGFNKLGAFQFLTRCGLRASEDIMEKLD